MNTLIRPEVLRQQSQAAIGETMRIVPISYAAFTAFLIAIIGIALTYAALAGYSRKETVEGFIAPSRGVVRVVAPRVGTITELLVNEGDLVAEDQILFRVVAEETSASGVGSDTAILEAMKQQKAILDEQIRNEAAHNRSEAQRLDTLVGKILRIVPDLQTHADRSTVSENGRYRIPNDNPFAAVRGARKEIWALGLRNPHRLTWAIDPANPANKRLIANSIGLHTWETVNVVHKGANYGCQKFIGNREGVVAGLQ